MPGQGCAAQQAHAADRLIEVRIVASLVFEGVFISFARRFTRRRLMRVALGGHESSYAYVEWKQTEIGYGDTMEILLSALAEAIMGVLIDDLA